MFWVVQAQVEHEDKKTGWSGSKQIPTFLLDSRTCGALTVERVLKVARSVVLGMADLVPAHVTVTPHVTVVEMDPDLYPVGVSS